MCHVSFTKGHQLLTGYSNLTTHSRFCWILTHCFLPLPTSQKSLGKHFETMKISHPSSNFHLGLASMDDDYCPNHSLLKQLFTGDFQSNDSLPPHPPGSVPLPTGHSTPSHTLPSPMQLICLKFVYLSRTHGFLFYSSYSPLLYFFFNFQVQIVPELTTESPFMLILRLFDMTLVSGTKYSRLFLLFYF